MFVHTVSACSCEMHQAGTFMKRLSILCRGWGEVDCPNERAQLCLAESAHPAQASTRTPSPCSQRTRWAQHAWASAPRSLSWTLRASAGRYASADVPQYVLAFAHVPARQNIIYTKAFFKRMHSLWRCAFVEQVLAGILLVVPLSLTKASPAGHVRGVSPHASSSRCYSRPVPVVGVFLA